MSHALVCHDCAALRQMLPHFAHMSFWPASLSCLAGLPNCLPAQQRKAWHSPLQALTAAVKIFGTVLAVPRLRSGMKAELGALYPLLLLRPIEAER